MRRLLFVVIALVVLVTGYSAWVVSRPLPVLQPHAVLGTLPSAQPVQLPWPSFGQAAAGAVGYGLLDSHGTPAASPTASTAKLITALAVLQRKPLAAGQQGPTLTLSDTDAQIYNAYVAEQGSVVPVNVGEQISEYQVLQAMMLPSANNMADTLATWAFGSTSNYVAYANTFVKQLGMTNTHVADASGFSPQTTSTAADLVKLGIAALQNPVLAGIVSQQQAVIPVAGTVNNVDSMLGQDGINGIKTGNTPQAGGVFVGSGTYQLGGHAVTIVTAIMDAPDLDQALQATPPLLTAAQAGFTNETLVHKGEIVGYYNTPWHTSANVVATADMKVFVWRSQPPVPSTSLGPLSVQAKSGQAVGTIQLMHMRTQARLQQSPGRPSWQWRLLHP